MNKIGEKILLKMPVFEVVEKEFSNFKPIGLNCNDWVMLIVADGKSKDNPNCVFVKQTRWGLEDTTIEFPCGTVEESDYHIKSNNCEKILKNAAIREFEEETGIDLGPHKHSLINLGSFNPNPAYFNNIMTIFSVVVPDLKERFEKRNKQHLDEHEDCEVFVDRLFSQYNNLASHAMGICALQKACITMYDVNKYE